MRVVSGASWDGGGRGDRAARRERVGRRGGARTCESALCVARRPCEAASYVWCARGAVRQHEVVILLNTRRPQRTHATAPSCAKFRSFYWTRRRRQVSLGIPTARGPSLFRSKKRTLVAFGHFVRSSHIARRYRSTAAYDPIVTPLHETGRGAGSSSRRRTASSPKQGTTWPMLMPELRKLRR